MFCPAKMKRSLSILLIDDCPITSVRLVELLQKEENVDVVFYAKDVAKGVAMFQVRKINVLILVSHLANDRLQQLTELCKVYECKVIMLSEYTHLSFRRLCKRLGIHLLDKTSQTTDIAVKLKEI